MQTLLIGLSIGLEREWNEGLVVQEILIQILLIKEVLSEMYQLLARSLILLLCLLVELLGITMPLQILLGQVVEVLEVEAVQIS